MKSKFLRMAWKALAHLCAVPSTAELSNLANLRASAHTLAFTWNALCLLLSGWLLLLFWLSSFQKSFLSTRPSWVRFSLFLLCWSLSQALSLSRHCLLSVFLFPPARPHSAWRQEWVHSLHLSPATAGSMEVPSKSIFICCPCRCFVLFGRGHYILYISMNVLFFIT